MQLSALTKYGDRLRWRIESTLIRTAKEVAAGCLERDMEPIQRLTLDGEFICHGNSER